MNTSVDHGKGLFAKLAASTPSQQDIALAVVRVGFGLSLALAHGLGKLSHPDQFVNGLTQGGFPAPALLAWVAILSEFAGGLLLALGLFARPAAAFVIGTLGVAAFHVHAADPYQKKELALAYVVIGLAILIAGPGRYSVDALLARRTPNDTRAHAAT
jgi:putative oxidoreductase